MINKLINNKTGQIIFSIILGLGFSSLFRRSCKNNCIIIKGPSTKEISGNIYNFEKKCYKYSPYFVRCKKKNELIHT